MRALLRIALTALGALLLATGSVSAQTQRFQLTDQTWVDLGAAPYTVRTLGSPAAIVIDTTAPSGLNVPFTVLGSEVQTGMPVTATGMHAYARALNTSTAVATYPADATGGGAASGASAASSSGGISAFSRIPSSAASNNLTVAKASAGRAYTYQGCNTTAATVYLRLYNAASTGAVMVGTTPVFSGPYAFPANTCVQVTTFAADIGLYASTGLAYAFGTAPTDSGASPAAHFRTVRPSTPKRGYSDFAVEATRGIFHS